MFEFLEELLENRTQETGMEGTEAPNESAAGTMENTGGGGFYIKNGILYNGRIDTMLSDLSQDLSENLQEQRSRKPGWKPAANPIWTVRALFITLRGNKTISL